MIGFSGESYSSEDEKLPFSKHRSAKKIVNSKLAKTTHPITPTLVFLKRFIGFNGSNTVLSSASKADGSIFEGFSTILLSYY